MSLLLDELRQRQKEKVRKKNICRRTMIVGLSLLLVFGSLILYNVIIVNRHIGITYYTCYSGKIQEPVRLALLADLHNKEYGENNAELLDKIRAQNPDLIVVAGDMVMKNDLDVSVAVRLCREMIKIAPVYYQYGNHESMLMRYGINGDKVPIDEYLEKEGVHFFYNDYCTVETNGNAIDIAGISVNTENYSLWAEDMMKKFEKSNHFKLLLSHYPSLYYDTLYSVDIDLAVAGHYHGGVVRIPGFGGLYHIDDGFFPRYAGGQYSLEKGELIVSRGLGGHEIIPRINNGPELVVIDLKRMEARGEK